MSLKENFTYNLILTVSSILFPLITFPYIAHKIGPIGVGKIQFINTFVQYFIMIAALGIPMYGVREVAKIKNNLIGLKRTITELLFINITTSLILLIVYLSIIYQISFFKNDIEYYKIAGIMLLTGFCNIEWLFSGLEEFKFIAFRSVIIKAITLVFLLFFLRTKDDTLIYLWILVASNVLNNLWNIWYARKYVNFKLLDFLDFHKHWKPIIYIFSTIAAISVYAMLDTILLGFIKGDEAVGYYTAASRITKPVIPILTCLGTILIPKISIAFSNNDFKAIKKYSNYSLQFVTLIGIPICFGTIILSEDLIMLLSGKSFLPSNFSVKFFSGIVLIIGLSNIWAIQLLTPAGKDKYVTFSVVLGLILSVILNFILIPIYSYNGAVISNFITEFFVMGMFLFYAKKFFKVRLNIKSMITSLIISLFFYPIWLFSKFIFPYQHFMICIFTIIMSSFIYLFIQIFFIKNELLLTQLNSFKIKLTNL